MKLEIHLTYRCTLSCPYCNRGCSLNQTHTPDFPFPVFSEFLERTPGWDSMVLIGGEPTLHPEFTAFARRARAAKQDAGICIYSNAYTEQAKVVLKELEPLKILNSGGTEKPNGSITHDMPNIFVSPWDLGLGQRKPCGWSPLVGGCGYSVDALGITACAIGGAIDGILGLGQRTWSFAEADARLPELCKHCGANYEFGEIPPDELWEWNGQRVSKTWHRALAGRKITCATCAASVDSSRNTMPRCDSDTQLATDEFANQQRGADGGESADAPKAVGLG